jgi:DNA-binding winged helix-turn-helix (wHTH) protein
LEWRAFEGKLSADWEAALRISFGEFVLDDEARLLSRDGQPVHLTPKALELLEFLVEMRPRAVSKEELNERLWPSTHVTGANLPVLVHEVREALGDDPQTPHWLRTVARFGYSFCGEARPDPDNGVDESPWDCRILWGGREILLRAGENILGRAHDAAVWIDDTSVSRHHAVIHVSAGGATLEDSASRNGTFRRGQRIDGEVALEDGDEFVIGGVLLTFRIYARGGDPETSRSTAPLLPFGQGDD